MRRLRRLIAMAKDELSSAEGLDMTGEGAIVPSGLIRVPSEMAQIYREAGHKVETRILVVAGVEKEVTLVSLGDPEEVSRKVLTKNFFPKPNETM